MGSMPLIGCIAVIAVSTLAGNLAPAQASHGCNARNIEGNYGYMVNGTNVGNGLVASVGVVSADGEGRLTATDTVSANGLVLHRTITGTYTVNPACTGSATFTDNFGQSTHLDFVLVDRGREFQFIQTDPATVTTGVAKKQ